ncbi:MAG: Kiwa anti-phage protein KwaB-like domain-containing protein [bacterium]
MTLEFDVNNVRTVEFGVGREDDNDQTFVCITVDAGVQDALRDMVKATWDAMREQPEGPSQYEPSEKYGSTEYVYLPLTDDLAERMRQLHQTQNLPLDNHALDDSSNVFSYFARITDKQGRRLTALRRATQFKGVLKSRLIRFTTDALKIVEDKVFKLDTDFDLLIDGRNVHIQRPSGFEFAGKLQEAVLAAVPQNIKSIQHDLPFVDFSGIEMYTKQHLRAARYLASIRAQKETKNIDKGALKKRCAEAGVEINVVKGKVMVQDGHEMGFLEVLDRRRYTTELVKGAPERYKAASRRKLDAKDA